MSSSDGFCSSVTFAPGELGQVYTGATAIPHHHPPLAISVTNSAISSPVPTPTAPTHATAPSNIKAPSPASANRHPSPTRSNSTSSIATQSSFAQIPSGTIAINPTPTIGTVPSVAAGNANPGPLPLVTPPMTPMSTSNISATSSVTGSSLGKREFGGTSESEADDQKPKKRRIAPTPVTSEDVSMDTPKES